MLCVFDAAATAAAAFIVVVGVFHFQSKYTYLRFSVNSKCPSNQFETINTNSNGISVYFQLQKYIWLWLWLWLWLHRTQYFFFVRCGCHCSFFISNVFDSCIGFLFSAFHVDFINSTKREKRRKKIVHTNIHVHVIHS